MQLRNIIVPVMFGIMTIFLIIDVTKKYYGGSNVKYSTTTIANKNIKGCIAKNDNNYTGEEIIKYENNYTSVDDPNLVKFIKRRWLVYPSPKKRVMSGNERHYSQFGQSKFVDNLLKKKKSGFFIESGAADGVEFSNTLFFERFRGWTGLLVEPQVHFFNKLVKQRPGAYAINSCLSTGNKTSKVQFEMSQFLGRISHASSKRKDPKMEVQCFPLFSILLALGVDTIDYFSLDVEGVELQILQTIPWNKLRINVLTIEYRALGQRESYIKQLLKDIRNLFSGMKQYKEVGKLANLDVVFARKDILLRVYVQLLEIGNK